MALEVRLWAVTQVMFGCSAAQSSKDTHARAHTHTHARTHAHRDKDEDEGREGMQLYVEEIDGNDGKDACVCARARACAGGWAWESTLSQCMTVKVCTRVIFW